jgi:hypothetical protein
MIAKVGRPRIKTMTNATEFVAAFVASYDEARRRFSHEWSHIWGTSWSQFMIWDEQSVIRVVADKLKLQCHPGEPLRLDAVFHAPGDRWSWFPIRVVIEHENSPVTFDNEVQKLLSIRCPVKVGITYSLTSDVRGDRSWLEKLHSRIAQSIRGHFAAMDALIKEDPETE